MILLLPKLLTTQSPPYICKAGISVFYAASLDFKEKIGYNKHIRYVVWGNGYGSMYCRVAGVYRKCR